MIVNPFSYLIEKLKDYTADKIPFNNTGTSLSSNNVEGAIKELNKTDNLFSNKASTAGTYEEFDLSDNLSKYQFLDFIYMFYGNTMATIVEPVVVFNSQTSSGSRVMLYYNNNLAAEIYKVSNTRIAIKMADVSGPYTVRIQGIN